MWGINSVLIWKVNLFLFHSFCLLSRLGQQSWGACHISCLFFGHCCRDHCALHPPTWDQGCAFGAGSEWFLFDLHHQYSSFFSGGEALRRKAELWQLHLLKSANEWIDREKNQSIMIMKKSGEWTLGGWNFLRFKWTVILRLLTLIHIMIPLNLQTSLDLHSLS